MVDLIRRFDIELDKEVWFPGETLRGTVVIQTVENLRVQGVRLHLRGRAHTEWKITRAGERRTVKQDEFYIDERKLLWGKDKHEEGTVPIMPRGDHRHIFEIKLPESALPCSFESKIGTIRYYIRVIIDMPYESPPQGIKYFTVIGPHIDCMDERLLVPCHANTKRNTCCLCCGRGPISMTTTLERTGYCCGENIRLKAEVQNGSDTEVWLVCQLMQYVEFFINKGVLGLSKEVQHTVLQAESPRVPAHQTVKLDDLQALLKVPVMPPSMVDVCGLVQIYYVLHVDLEMGREGDALEVKMPITIATLPFRIPNTPAPDLHYAVAAENVEGGMYISSEFQLGQVYMGDDADNENDSTILYRPVYVTVSPDPLLLHPPPRSLRASREDVTSQARKEEDKPLSASRMELPVTFAEKMESRSKEDLTLESATKVTTKSREVSHNVSEDSGTSQEVERISLKEISAQTATAVSKSESVTSTGRTVTVVSKTERTETRVARAQSSQVEIVTQRLSSV